jgi:hypothetical protein
MAKMKVGDIVTTEDLLGGKQTGIPSKLRWLRGKKSPFGMDVLDCRSVALTTMSTSADPAIAESFLRNAKSDGTALIGTLPENPARLDYPLTFQLGEVHLDDGPLFIASQMEEKWNVYLFKGILYFVRSWTGILTYAARCEVTGGTLTVNSIVANEKSIDERDPSFPIRELFFLVVSHVLGHVYPHPVLASVERDEDSIAMFSFSQYGKMGLFAALLEDPQPPPGEMA